MKNKLVTLLSPIKSIFSIWFWILAISILITGCQTNVTEESSQTKTTVQTTTIPTKTKTITPNPSQTFTPSPSLTNTPIPTITPSPTKKPSPTITFPLGKLRPFPESLQVISKENISELSLLAEVELSTGSQYPREALAFSKDRSLVAVGVGYEYSKIWIIEVDTRKIIIEIDTRQNELNDLYISHDNQFVFASFGNLKVPSRQTIVVGKFRISDGELVHEIGQDYSSFIFGAGTFAFDSKENKLAVGPAWNYPSIHLWEQTSLNHLNSFSFIPPPGISTYRGIDFSPDGSMLAIGGGDVEVYDSSTLTRITKFKTGDWTYDLAFSSDNNHLFFVTNISGFRDKCVFSIYNFQKGTLSQSRDINCPVRSNIHPHPEQASAIFLNHSSLFQVWENNGKVEYLYMPKIQPDRGLGNITSIWESALSEDGKIITLFGVLSYRLEFWGIPP